jgi:hypothetical protein
VPDATFTVNDLTALLEGLALQRAPKTPDEAAGAQVDFLIARMTLLTGVLRRAEANEATRLASRMLIADLAQVAAQFRGSTNAISGSLSTVLDDLRGALERLDAATADSPGRT